MQGEQTGIAMTTFDFKLTFKLPEPDQSADQFLDALFEQGCDDALVGTGLPGRVALDFARESTDAKTAVLQAVRQVFAAIPGAKLIEASPDLVGASDISACLGVSRQAIQKAVSSRPDFPCALHSGQSSIWHLAEVLDWYAKTRKRPVDAALLDLARINLQLNVLRQQELVNPELGKEFRQKSREALI